MTTDEKIMLRFILPLTLVWSFCLTAYAFGG
jgi:hypothetical protein